MIGSGAGKTSRMQLDAADLLPNRLTAIAGVLAREIEEPVRALYALPTKDWVVMQVLAVNGAIPPAEIHRVGGQNKPQISRALKCLVDRELVVRSPHPDDDRTFLVSLTEPGLAMYTDILKQMRRRQADLLKELPADEAGNLRSLLKNLEGAFGGQDIPAAAMKT